MGSPSGALSVMVMAGLSGKTAREEETRTMTHTATAVEQRPPAPEPASLPLTVTHVLEHLFCPRFTYFEHVLAVPERQERRLLVQKGRQAHEERKKINPTYLRKKLGVVERMFDVPLASPKLGARGAVDEVFTLSDGSMAPFDYKFAETESIITRRCNRYSTGY
jgi:hypothetical protein